MYQAAVGELQPPDAIWLGYLVSGFFMPLNIF
jgi:hypothetical protein